MPADPSIFSIDEEQVKRRSLVRNVRTARQALRQQRKAKESNTGLESDKQ